VKSKPYNAFVSFGLTPIRDFSVETFDVGVGHGFVNVHKAIFWVVAPWAQDDCVFSYCF
jgi:hypothetical protein